MQLITGCDITIRYSPETKRYIAFIYVGPTHHEGIAADPVRAIGLAVMQQAGFTAATLKAELAELAKKDEYVTPHLA